MEGEAVKMEFIAFVLAILRMLERGEVEDVIKILREIIKKDSA